MRGTHAHTIKHVNYDPTSFYFFCGTLFNLVRTVRGIANDHGLLLSRIVRRCRVP